MNSHSFFNIRIVLGPSLIDIPINSDPTYCPIHNINPYFTCEPKLNSNQRPIKIDTFTTRPHLQR